MRTALHARIIKETKLQYTATVVILGMIFYDIVEIIWVAGSSINFVKTKDGAKEAEEKNLKDGFDPLPEGTQIEQRRLRKNSAVILEQGLAFFEDDMEAAGITPEMAKKRGYIRILDYNRNLHLV